MGSAARAQGLNLRGLAPSPILGQKGNREFFLLVAPGGADLGAAFDPLVTEVTTSKGGAGAPPSNP